MHTPSHHQAAASTLCTHSSQLPARLDPLQHLHHLLNPLNLPLYCCPCLPSDRPQALPGVECGVQAHQEAGHPQGLCQGGRWQQGPAGGSRGLGDISSSSHRANPAVVASPQQDTGGWGASHPPQGHLMLQRQTAFRPMCCSQPPPPEAAAAVYLLMFLYPCLTQTPSLPACLLPCPPTCRRPPALPPAPPPLPAPQPNMTERNFHQVAREIKLMKQIK